jgi:hypothetical protein
MCFWALVVAGELHHIHICIVYIMQRFQRYVSLQRLALPYERWHRRRGFATLQICRVHPRVLQLAIRSRISPRHPASRRRLILVFLAYSGILLLPHTLLQLLLLEKLLELRWQVLNAREFSEQDTHSLCRYAEAPFFLVVANVILPDLVVLGVLR